VAERHQEEHKSDPADACVLAHLLERADRIGALPVEAAAMLFVQRFRAGKTRSGSSRSARPAAKKNGTRGPNVPSNPPAPAR
jgi:hypothetical protein